MSILMANSADELRDVSEVIRAEALFASTLQPSDSPSGELVRETVTATIRRLGARTCAAVLAGEFGDHPDGAAARMTWALASVRRADAAPDPYGDGVSRFVQLGWRVVIAPTL